MGRRATEKKIDTLLQLFGFFCMNPEVLLLLVLFIYSHNSALVNDVMRNIVIKYCLTNYWKQNDSSQTNS